MALRKTKMRRAPSSGRLFLCLCAAALAVPPDGLAADPYSSKVLDDSPSAYFRMDDASGSATMLNELDGPDGTHYKAPVMGRTGALEHESVNRAIAYSTSDNDHSEFTVTAPV